MRYLSRNELSYGGIAKHVRRYKSNQSRIRIDHATDAVIDPSGLYNSIRLYNTDVVRYYPDGTIQLFTGGWATQSTRDRINKYTPSEISIYTKRGTWYLVDPDGPKTKDRIWKCKTCYGKNLSMLPQVIEEHNDATRQAFLALAQAETWAPHEYTYPDCRQITKYNFDDGVYEIVSTGCGYDNHLRHCYRCNDEGKVNYGAKRTDIEFVNGMKIRIDNGKMVVVE